ncbi:MAG: gluconeogenesis factor YvcK family protein [Oscillochloridaceae bacterium umkhey_bin13]
MEPLMTNGQHEHQGLPRLVVLGGGGGVSQVLLGAASSFGHLTGIIAVTDSGRSTGIARDLAQMPAPGDLRATMAALAAEPEGLAARLVQHRFQSSQYPALDGMAFGNLLIAALTEILGDFGQAISEVGRMLNCTATLVPAATVSTHLCAELVDGQQRRGELAVRGLDKPAIRRLFLDPPVPANPVALRAIANADIVALGPGSFYTSVLATLCFTGMVEALRDTRATVVWIGNTSTQPGQTDGMSLADHVAALVDMLGPEVLDAALLNQGEAINASTEASYVAQGLQVLRPSDDDRARIAAMGVTPLVRDLSETSPEAPRQLWNKLDSIRHAPELIGMALWKLALDRAE